MGYLDALLGRLYSRGTEQELLGGINFTDGLACTPNLTTRLHDVSIVGSIDDWAQDNGGLDLGGNPIVNHYDYRGEWVAVAAGALTESLGSFALGLANTQRRSMMVEVDVQDNTTRANAKRDVWQLLVQLNSTNTVELTDVAVSTNTDTGASPSLTLTGPNSGYTYTAAYSAGAIEISLTRDGATARNAQLTISAEPVRTGP